MNDDYLWDGSEPPDPEIQRLERLLAPLRTTRSAHEIRLRANGARVLRWKTARFLGPALGAAASIALIVGLSWQTLRNESTAS